MAEGEDKTESATPKRRSEARKRGQVPRSNDLSSIFVLCALVLALHSLTGMAAAAVLQYFQNAFAHLDDIRLTPGIVMEQGGTAVLTLVRAVGPLVLLAMTAGVVVNVAQSGFNIATEGLKPNFNKMNPLSGLKRLVSTRSLVELVKALYKIGLVSWIAFATIRGSYPQLVLMTRLEAGQAVSLVGDVAYRMMLRVVVTMLFLAALDYFYQRYQFEKSIRMTKEEVKQEYKQMEGNPQIKARIRARQREISKKRMMSEVPTADVIITNPTHFAIALKYDPEKTAAPVVVAKGQDFVAQKIRAVAQENDVPIVENPPLARALYKQVELGREIPNDLYGAVAEVLAFVFEINQRRRERQSRSYPAP